MSKREGRKWEPRSGRNGRKEEVSGCPKGEKKNGGTRKKDLRKGSRERESIPSVSF